MAKNKDWWNFSLNPIWGCENKCSYCYARRIARNFFKEMIHIEMNFKYGLNWSYSDLEYEKLLLSVSEFKPTWFENNYQKKLPKKPSIIFINSMSEPQYWKQKWYERIVKRIAENMQHTFVVLTKHPEVYKKYTFPHNTILGVTCTTQKKLNEFECHLLNWFGPENRILLVIEPIQGVVKIFNYLKKRIDWLHIGIETGKRKGKYIPDQEEIEQFYYISNVPVFMKNSLKAITDWKLRQEWPKGVKG